MKHFLHFLSAVLFNGVTGAVFGTLLGCDPLSGAAVANILGILLGFFPPSRGILREGVLKEIWTGEMVKALRGRMQGSWLDGIPDASSVAENDVIHLVDVGVDPEVLINQTTYPIPMQVLDDEDLAISLDKFQTKVTPIKDDELYAISYDKMGRVKESHSNAISDAKLRKAAHAFCAKKDSAKTPILATTGEKEASGRRKMTVGGLLAMKAAMDDNGVPAENRRLVLCTDHVNDLLATDQNFREQYNIDRNDGTIARLYGFDIHEFAGTPFYTKGGEKKGLADAAEAGEYRCSFAFYIPRAFKCTGSTKMYYSVAATDPANQQNLINFRHYFIAMPKKNDAGCVMMSAHED